MPKDPTLLVSTDGRVLEQFRRYLKSADEVLLASAYVSPSHRSAFLIHLPIGTRNFVMQFTLSDSLRSSFLLRTSGPSLVSAARNTCLFTYAQKRRQTTLSSDGTFAVK